MNTALSSVLAVFASFLFAGGLTTAVILFTETEHRSTTQRIGTPLLIVGIGMLLLGVALFFQPASSSSVPKIIMILTNMLLLLALGTCIITHREQIDSYGPGSRIAAITQRRIDMLFRICGVSLICSAIFGLIRL